MLFLGLQQAASENGVGKTKARRGVLLLMILLFCCALIHRMHDVFALLGLLILSRIWVEFQERYSLNGYMVKSMGLLASGELRIGFVQILVDELWVQDW